MRSSALAMLALVDSCSAFALVATPSLRTATTRAASPQMVALELTSAVNVAVSAMPTVMLAKDEFMESKHSEVEPQIMDSSTVCPAAHMHLQPARNS